ncbi:MAG TPA: EAL domain-containing protein [Burkholderiales bacterium]|jgi:diguanylate cyclase (GGDEF)-like protein|nr:EAL domain-containing protein [Burkholderiales bacterium]
MKLSRLLIGLISLLWVLVFIGTLMIVVSSTKDFLQKTLEQHAKDTATFLGLAITHSGRVKDAETVERMTAAVFDSGYYSEILVKTMKGAPLVTKKVEQTVPDVPQQFVEWFPLTTPRMSSIVMDGWIQAAQIEVVSHPGHAYSELYRISVRSFWVLFAAAVVSLVTVLVVLRLALKPLDDMEQQAINISKRQFTLLPKLPWARELRRVANAMNGMVVAVERMLTEQTDLAEKMRKKAYVDAVTGLMNRNDFAERLSHLIGAPTKLSQGVLAVVRIRGFAAYNEKNGRAEGDALLKRVAGLLGKVAEKRPQSMLAKLDGPEFGMLVPEIAEPDAAALGDEMLAALAEIEEFPRTENSLMTSIGMAYYRHHAGASFGKLMSAVASAMAIAQARGIPAWHLQPLEVAEQAATMYAEINNMFKVGLPAERVTVLFQAVKPCRVPETEWNYRSESVVRIIDSTGQLIRAGEFIATAKRLGALQLLDRVVVDKVVQRIAAEGPVRGGATAVNLSVDTIIDPTFVDWLHGKLASVPDVARHIILEVAEHAIIANIGSVKAAFSRLRETGVRLSIDRFGQSTASVGYLRGLEVDYIKIDGSYTRGMVDSTDRQFFVQALVGIAHGLNIQVVTEYIETEKDFDLARSLGVDGAQGYFIGRPE